MLDPEPEGFDGMGHVRGRDPQRPYLERAGCQGGEFESVGHTHVLAAQRPVQPLGRPGGAVHTLSTVLPGRGLAAELISTYVGHTDTPTIATHLMLGPVGQPASIATAEHAHEDLDPVESARECAYDHAHQLIELLDAAGRQVTVQLDELSFTELERSG